jgi:hypothetical protein
MSATCAFLSSRIFSTYYLLLTTYYLLLTTYYLRLLVVPHLLLHLLLAQGVLLREEAPPGEGEG